MLDVYENIQEQVEMRCLHFLDMAEHHFGRSFNPPHVRCNLRGTTGGTYSSKKDELAFNGVLMRENPEEYWNQVIPHEVAHKVQRDVYGHYRHGKRVMPHGREWKAIMRLFGLNPDRCHKMDVSNARVRRVARNYTYKCRCQTHNLTKVRHNRIQQGIKYRCGTCKNPLEYAGV